RAPDTLLPFRLWPGRTEHNKNQAGALLKLEILLLRVPSQTPVRVFPGSFALQSLPPEATPLRAAAHYRQHMRAPETRRAPAGHAFALGDKVAQFVGTVPRAFDSRFFSSRANQTSRVANRTSP